jgi:DNA-binding NtrC family response regulator
VSSWKQAAIARSSRLGMVQWPSMYSSADLKRIDLLITDIAHPGMDGFALIRAVREIDPDIKVLVVSGQAVHETVRRRLDNDSIPFLEKPFHLRALLDIVGMMLARSK